VNATTIVETVQLLVKFTWNWSKDFIGGFRKLFFTCRRRASGKRDLLVKINPDLYTSSLNRTIAGLSGSKAGLSQAEAQFREAKAIMKEINIISKGIFLNQIGINQSLLLKLRKPRKSLLILVCASASVNEARDNLGEL
jgi:HlyD family secretion protein